jgi:Ca2+-binding RTX toxin-like protein
VVVGYLQGPFTIIEPAHTGAPAFRRLSTAFAELKGAELFVNSTNGDDHIIVERVHDDLFMNLNGIVQRLDANAVRSLSISGLGGDDDVVNATALPTTIDGGDGKDTIWGGIGPDSIRGQGGEDRLHGGDGNDLLFGDTANDTLHGGDGTDTLWGGTGADELLFGELLDGVLP